MDIALRYDPESQVFDLALEDGELAADEGLQTAVILSLFTDRLADDDDRLPDGGNDRRGWWADAYNERPHGSRLWLLSREKTEEAVLRRAKTYAEEALAWLIEDGIAAEVVVEAEQHTGYGVNDCVVDLVSDYLVDRIAPDDGTECA